MRYLVRAPDSQTYQVIVKRLKKEGIQIFLMQDRRKLLSTDTLPDALIQEFVDQHAKVAPEARFEPDEATAANG